MKFPLNLVSTVKRLDWIRNSYSPNEVIYMGDGIFDQYVFRKIGYAIAPSNADPLAKKYADYVTKLNAVCTQCGDVATYSYRIVKDNKQILVGESEKYEARCVTCFYK